MDILIKRQLIVGKLKNKIDKAIEEESKTIELDLGAAKWILNALIKNWKKAEEE